MTVQQGDLGEREQREQETERSSSMAWMPSMGIVEQWATFAATFLTYPAFMATSVAFSAFSFEASALRHYNEACWARSNRAQITARAAFEQVVEDLRQASSQWMSAMYWLERLASGGQYTASALDSLRVHFCQTVEQIERLSLLTQQVYQTCVLFYQQHGMLVDGKEKEEKV